MQNGVWVTTYARTTRNATKPYANRISFLSYIKNWNERRRLPPRRRRWQRARGETARRSLQSRSLLHANVFASPDYLLRPRVELEGTQGWSCWPLSLTIVLFWLWGALAAVTWASRRAYSSSSESTSMSGVWRRRRRRAVRWRAHVPRARTVCESLRHRAAPPAIAAALPPPRASPSHTERTIDRRPRPTLNNPYYSLAHVASRPPSLRYISIQLFCNFVTVNWWLFLLFLSAKNLFVTLNPIKTYQLKTFRLL